MNGTKSQAYIEEIAPTLPRNRRPVQNRLGCLTQRADRPDSDETGETISFVEMAHVANHMCQDAVTENGSFVDGMKRYFDLVWEWESCALNTRNYK